MQITTDCPYRDRRHPHFCSIEGIAVRLMIGAMLVAMGFFAQRADAAQGQIPGFVGEMRHGDFTTEHATGTWDARANYVTSDGSATHAATPGSPVFGVNHDGVADLIVSRTDGTFRLSGSLLWDGRSVLTAAHGVTDSNGNMITNSVTATWELSTGDVSRSTATVFVHPSYSGDLLQGYDLAILRFDSAIDANVPRYDIFRDAGLAELNTETIKVGYGRSGFGETGATTSSGTKRYGKNKWEDDGLGDNGVSGITNDTTQLTYDFDSNYRNLEGTATDDEAHDAFNFFYGRSFDLGYGDDEVGAAPGDSGGPTFILDDGQYKIAGVTSYGLRLVDTSPPPPDTTSDVTGSLDSSWGEFAVDARLAESSMQGFVDDFIVPEPASFALLGAGGLVLLRRRRPGLS